jgi:hypothetical protein
VGEEGVAGEAGGDHVGVDVAAVRAGVGRAGGGGGVAGRVLGVAGGVHTLGRSAMGRAGRAGGRRLGRTPTQERWRRWLECRCREQQRRW